MRDGLQCELTLERDGGFRLDATFVAPVDGITGVFGPSGSGKTTLLRCLAGLETGASGRVSVGNDTWQDDASGVFLPPWQRSAGVVFQEPRLFSHLDVDANLAFGAGRRGAALDAQALDALGLSGLGERRPQALSGGEQRRVALGRALARGPQLLLLDEPLTGLDLVSRARMLSCLMSVQRESGIPMLYVSHDIDEISELCDYVVVIGAGQVRHSGPVAQLLGDPAVFGTRHTGALIEAAVAGYDEASGLTRLRFSGGELLVPGDVEGTHVRACIRASDVSIALTLAEDTSILNRLTAHVESVEPFGDYAYVRLRCGGAHLVSQVSRWSVQQLQIVPGGEVVAQIKGVAVRQLHHYVEAP